MGSSGLEPPTSRLSGVRSNHLSYEPIVFRSAAVLVLPLPLGGDEEVRTPDPLRAKQVLSQLSYTPISEVVDSRLRLPNFESSSKNLQNRTETN